MHVYKESFFIIYNQGLRFTKVKISLTLDIVEFFQDNILVFKWQFKNPLLESNCCLSYYTHFLNPFLESNFFLFFCN